MWTFKDTCAGRRGERKAKTAFELIVEGRNVGIAATRTVAPLVSGAPFGGLVKRKEPFAVRGSEAC